MNNKIEKLIKVMELDYPPIGTFTNDYINFKKAGNTKAIKKLIADTSIDYPWIDGYVDNLEKLLKD